MSMTPIRSPGRASLLACLTLSSTACTPALRVQPSHPVEVTRYVERPIAEGLTQPLERCALPPEATWAEVWSWALCSDKEVSLANCRLDRIADRHSSDCDAMVPSAPAQGDPRG